MVKEWILKYDGSLRSLKWHFLLWLSFYVIFTFVMSYYGDWKKYLIINAFNVFLFIVAYYMLRYWQIPKIYQRGKPLLFVVSLVGSILFCYSLYWGLRMTLMQNIAPMYNEKPFVRLGEFMVRTVRFYSPSMLLLVWEYQYSRIQDQNRIRALEKEKLGTELKFLKAQINPHFLFNTLNNLYSFVVRESPKATDMLDRLTGILEYVFEGSKNDQVPLKAEVSTIEDYLELEKIRYGDRLTVNYDVSGDMDLHLSPLILLSVIENAFKHGASGDIDQPIIDITIGTKEETILCDVWNTKSAHQGEINDEYKSGIGLSNIKRQLDLIYPKKYALEIDDQSKRFTFSLAINTAA